MATLFTGDCPSGQQVNESTNVCSLCEVGTYRDKTQTWTCQPCPSPFTTLNAGSMAVSACDIRESFRNYCQGKRSPKTPLVENETDKDGTFQATSRFQDSDSFDKAIEMAFRCILIVNSHLSGFKV